jgi:methylmalonyl-CoA mutase N-terminal domain/subunit
MTISGPAVPAFCMYLVAAERQGCDISALNGTLQTDIFKEYIAQKEWLFEPEPHLRLIGDLMEYCAQQHPRLQAALGVRLPHPRGRVDGRAGARLHPRGRVRVRRARSVPRPRRRLVRTRPELLLRRHVDFFEEIAKFRAARRIWARWLRDATAPRPRRRSGCASTPRPPGSALTAQQPLNNVVRTAVEALPRCSAGPTRCTPTPSTRPSRCRASTPPRSRCAPSRCSWRRPGCQRRRPAGRQLVRRGAHRQDRGRGRAHLRPDPRRWASRARAPICRPSPAIGNVGKADRPWPMTSGILRGIEEGWFMAEIGDAAFDYQMALEQGQQEGRRRQLPHRVDQPRAGDPARQPRGGEGPGGRADRAQVGAGPGGGRRRRRARMVEVSRTSENMIPAMLDAVRAEATLGEICNALKRGVGHLPGARALLSSGPAGTEPCGGSLGLRPRDPPLRVLVAASGAPYSSEGEMTRTAAP